MSLPDAHALADALAAELPEAERDEARRFIAERLAPFALSEVGDEPERLVPLYERLAGRLESAEPEDRRAVLDMLAAEAELEDHNRAALVLAIGRYLRDHPEATVPRLWPRAESERWRDRADLEAEAERRLVALDAWKARVEPDLPAVWSGYRTLWLHARQALNSARVGSFATASGSLLDFLEDVGAPVSRFDVF